MPANVADRIILGNSSHSLLHCHAARGSSANSSVQLYAFQDGRVGPLSSSQRYKHNIADITDAEIEAAESLRAVSFVYNDDQSAPGLQYGLLSEDTHEKLPQICVYNAAGEPESVVHQALAPLLLASNKKLKAQVSKLEDQLSKLVARLEALEQKL